MSKAWFPDNALVKGDLAVGRSIFVFRNLREAYYAYKFGSRITVSSFDPMLVLQTEKIDILGGKNANMVQVLTTTGVFWVFETSLVYWSTAKSL